MDRAYKLAEELAGEAGGQVGVNHEDATGIPGGTR